MNNFEKYRELVIDGSRINLVFETDPEKYFCTPIGFKFIGSENGGIQYGFIEGFGDMTVHTAKVPDLSFRRCS